MNPRATLSAFTLSLGLGACSGRIDVGESPPDARPATPAPTPTPDAGAHGTDADGAHAPASAKAYFEEHVVPPTRLRCGNCHESSQQGPGGDFLGAGPADYHGALVGDARLIGATAAESLFLTKGAHAGPAFEPAERDRVAAWIELERARPAPAPGSGGSPGGGPDAGAGTGVDGGGTSREGTGGTMAEALSAFGRCMSREDFDASGAAEVARADSAAGPCHQCHSTGVGGLVLASDATATFDASRRLPTMLAWVIADTGPDGRARDVLPSGRLRDKGLEVGSHPRYTLSENGRRAIDRFFVASHTRWSTGRCD